MEPKPKLEFSFACGGWLQFYLFGVANCLIDHNLNDDCVAIGCSAGSLAATCMTIGADFDAILRKCKEELIPECRKDLKGPFKIAQYVGRCLDYAGDLSQFAKGNDRLFVQTTSIPDFKSVRVSKFHSKEDLRSSLVASCAAFPLAPPIRRTDGKFYIDGGFTDFQPVLSENTITVNPLYFWKADIKPSRYVPMHWAVLPPSNPSTIDWLFDLGYKDALEWMSKNGYSCTHVKDENNSCSKRLNRTPHRYDTHQKRSFQRFLGYGPTNTIMDFLLVFWLTILWKPFALVLIWTELFFLALINLSLAALKELIPTLPMIFLGSFILCPNMVEFSIMLVILFAVKILTCGSTDLSHWHKTFQYLQISCSPTLYLRSVPVFGSRVPVRAGRELEQCSLIYRVAMHIL
mmetsp:Transcript_27264/g.35760  ORF Transcript_27264/g.35760 Transcript_27264/m.35760 type:complete len:404 (+) Transcript_27264:174-1385(+)